MRSRLITLVCVLLSGCAAPPSSGELWVQRGIEQEIAFHRASAQERLERARAFELTVADELLVQERTRLQAALATCPSEQRVPLTLSEGNRVRDIIRVRAATDPPRLAQVGQLALADWRLRRAMATGQRGFCDGASAALSGQVSAIAIEAVPSMRHVAEYALDLADDLDGEAPLQHYLAAVYDGSLANASRAPEEEVDRLAPRLPAWEPDALWLSPSSARRALAE